MKLCIFVYFSLVCGRTARAAAPTWPTTGAVTGRWSPCGHPPPPPHPLLLTRTTRTDSTWTGRSRSPLLGRRWRGSPRRSTGEENREKKNSTEVFGVAICKIVCSLVRFVEKSRRNFQCTVQRKGLIASLNIWGAMDASFFLFQCFVWRGRFLPCAAGACEAWFRAEQVRIWVYGSLKSGHHKSTELFRLIRICF